MKPAPFLRPLFAFMERRKAGLHSQPAGFSESLRMFSAVILTATARASFPRRRPCGTFNLRWNVSGTHTRSGRAYSSSSFFLAYDKKIRSYLWPLKCQGTSHWYSAEPVMENPGRLTQLSSEVLALLWGNILNKQHTMYSRAYACAHTSSILCRIKALCFYSNQNTHV